LETVSAACRDHGKAAGILLRGAADVGPHVEMGYRFLGIGSDGGWMRDGARATVSAARASLG
jgi:2-keto-3-deoxy-L-rhamnonate aldolase RhmA